MTIDHDRVDVSAELLGILARAHPNVLLVGPQSATTRVIARVQQYLRQPIETWLPADAAALPTDHQGTLLIPAIDAIDDAQQERLSAWVDRRIGVVQIVALSPAPIVSLVDRGLFLPRLYYRLNHVYIDLSDGASAAEARV